MLRHADRLIHLGRLAEERPRLVAIAGSVAVEQHLRVPAADLGLLAAERDLVGLTKGRLIVGLGLVPLPAGRGSSLT